MEAGSELHRSTLLSIVTSLRKSSLGNYGDTKSPPQDLGCPLYRIKNAEGLCNVVVIGSKFLGFQQLRSAICKITGAAVDQTEVFVQDWQSAAVLANSQPLL